MDEHEKQDPLLGMILELRRAPDGSLLLTRRQARTVEELFGLSPPEPGSDAWGQEP